MTFTEKVVEIIGSIPYGKVCTYGGVAKLSGSPRGARQVVRILHTQTAKHDLPWFRVVNSKGMISLRPGDGYEEQKIMLLQEGIEFDDDDRIDLKRFGWKLDR